MQVYYNCFVHEELYTELYGCCCMRHSTLVSWHLTYKASTTVKLPPSPRHTNAPNTKAVLLLFYAKNSSFFPAVLLQFPPCTRISIAVTTTMRTIRRSSLFLLLALVVMLLLLDFWCCCSCILNLPTIRGEMNAWLNECLCFLAEQQTKQAGSNGRQCHVLVSCLNKLAWWLRILAFFIHFFCIHLKLHHAASFCWES